MPNDCSAADGTGAAVARSPVRISEPTPDCFVNVETALGQQFLDVL
jgi:hypothetical protein